MEPSQPSSPPPPPPPQWDPQPQQPQQPQWTPPPQQPVGWGGPGYGGPPARPTGVTLAAIYLIVMGILIALVGGGPAAVGGVVGTADPQDQIPGLASIGGAIAAVGIFIVVIGILAIVAGAGALGGKGWGRWLGVVISIIFAILLLLSGLGGLTNNSGVRGGVVALVLGVLFALCRSLSIPASGYASYRR